MIEAEQQESASSASSLPVLNKELEPNLWSCFISGKREWLVTYSWALSSSFIVIENRFHFMSCYFSLCQISHLDLLEKPAYTPQDQPPLKRNI